METANSYETRHGKWEFFLSPSLRVSPVSCFSPTLSSSSVLHYVSAISQTNSALSFLCLCLSFCSNWGKWVWASRKNRTVEVSNTMNLAVETREGGDVLRHPTWMDVENTANDSIMVCWAVRLCVWMCVCVSDSLCNICLYTMAIRKDFLHSTFVSRTLELLSLINVL